MRVLYLILLMGMFTSFAHGQPSIKIDSIDVSYVESVPLDSFTYYNTPDWPPCIQIIATIENNTDDIVRIHKNGFNGNDSQQIMYCFEGQQYIKNCHLISVQEWEQEDFEYSKYYPASVLVIRPHANKRFLFWMFLPSYPEQKKDWSDKESIVPNEETLQFIREILPSVRVRIFYNERCFLESVPLDLKKVVVTSNMTKERLN